MATPIQYKGRVWTCDAHNEEVETLISTGFEGEAKTLVNALHPKKGNICKECARLWEETPPSNR
jgi:hypothetical protein